MKARLSKSYISWLCMGGRGEGGAAAAAQFPLLPPPPPPSPFPLSSSPPATSGTQLLLFRSRNLPSEAAPFPLPFPPTVKLLGFRKHSKQPKTASCCSSSRPHFPSVNKMPVKLKFVESINVS